MKPNYVQRIRIRFRKFGPTRFIGHLDIARTWERILNRSKIPVAYTQGFNRRPRLQFATATPLGMTSDWEYIDIWLREPVDPETVAPQLAPRIAPGIEVLDVAEVALGSSALQNRTRRTSYRVKFLDPISVDGLETAVSDLLEATEIMRERTVKKKLKRYDLRPLVYDLAVVKETAASEQQSEFFLDMTLALEPSKTGRPDEVLKALGFDPLDCRVHRTGITFAQEEV